MSQVSGDCPRNDCPLHPQSARPDLPVAVRRRLADAYAEQARSDFEVYRTHLQSAAECHRLHYLQMACEKIAKAYRLRDLQRLPEDDLYSHAVFSKFIMNFLKSGELKQRYISKDAERRQIERYARSMAVQIEKLAPAVDRGATPTNVEYPWVIGETVFVPCRHAYPIEEQLKRPSRLYFLKLIETAIEDYERISLNG